MTSRLDKLLELLETGMCNRNLHCTEPRTSLRSSVEGFGRELDVHSMQQN